MGNKNVKYPYFRKHKTKSQAFGKAYDWRIDG